MPLANSVMKNLFPLLMSLVALCASAQDRKPVNEPLITNIYTADPSAHVFNGKIYIYPSHDIESSTPQDDEGGHFDMKDYHVLSMDAIPGKVKDNGDRKSTRL